MPGKAYLVTSNIRGKFGQVVIMDNGQVCHDPGLTIPPRINYDIGYKYINGLIFNCGGMAWGRKMLTDNCQLYNVERDQWDDMSPMSELKISRNPNILEIGGNAYVVSVFGEGWIGENMEFLSIYKFNGELGWNKVAEKNATLHYWIEYSIIN